MEQDILDKLENLIFLMEENQNHIDIIKDYCANHRDCGLQKIIHTLEIISVNQNRSVELLKNFSNKLYRKLLS